MPVPPSAPLRLLEREQELGELADAVLAAASGRPGLIAIEGPGGIGKTRLLTAARERALAAGMQLRTARGSEREQRLPFGVVEQLFAGEWPTIRPEGLVDAPTHEAEEVDVSFATLAALLAETERLVASGPVMLVVDDLHLCDEPSLQFLGYLARRFDRVPVAVLASLRPFERAETAPLLGELLAEHHTLSVRPSPLSAAAISALLTEALGHSADGAFSAACREATGGNPLLVNELAKTLRAEHVTPEAVDIAAVATLGPRAILRTVLVRLAGLPEGAGSLARAIAVLGEAADLPRSAELAGLSSHAASVAANALIGAEILVDGPGVQFVHPLVGSAVYEEIPPPDRADAHERAAAVARRHGQAVGTIAEHLTLAAPGRLAWAYGVLVDAARASLRAGAPADAVAYLRRALAEPAAAEHRAELVLMLGRATLLVDGQAAEAVMRDALALADGPMARAPIALELARLLMFIGRVREALPIVQEAAAELPEQAGDLRRMLATASLMAPLYDTGFAPPPHLVQLGRELPLEPGLGAKMLAALSARHWAYEGGPSDRCAALALASLEDGDLIRADSVFLSVSAVLVLELADRSEADTGWAALLREMRLNGSGHTRIAVNLFRGYGLARRGELAAAEATLAEALEAVHDWNGVQGSVHASAFLGLVHRERGDLVRARTALESIPRPDDASDEARLWLDSELALLNAEGRHEEALAGAAEAERRFAAVVQPIDSPPLQHRALALDGLGRRDEALVAARAGLEQARIWGAPGTVARALRTLGLIERGAAGIEHLQAAVDATTGTRARLELAKSQVELGAALRAAGRSKEARPALRAALELAAALGTAGLGDRARRELHAAGGRPRTVALSGPDALTSAERRVAERAAVGETNREIAGALFVSQKTVELHLSNSYRKLGIAGRRELAGALAEL